MTTVSLVFSSHRPETLAVSRPLMCDHDAVFLEDPPTSEFRFFLEGKLSLEDYLMTLDAEFPTYMRRSCAFLKQLHGQGIPLFQTEPFLEILMDIHMIFADGGSPGDIDVQSPMFTVYQVEREATGRLLRYYQAVMKGNFDATVEAVKGFARADAARFLLRDRMRAKALAPAVCGFSRPYVEAGDMHHALYLELKKALRGKADLRAVYLMAPVVKPLLGKRQTLGPGDVLTLAYLYRPRMRHKFMDLLAARSVVFTKLLEKEEMEDGNEMYPHIRDEVHTIRTVRQLSYEDCKAVFPHIRLAKTIEARAVVETFLQKKQKR